MRSSRSPSDRRSRLTGFLVAGFLAFFVFGPVVLPTSIADAAPLRRASVRVELEGVGAIANHVRRSLPQHLARELAQNPVEGYPPGARLVVRVIEVFLANEPGVRGGGFGGGLAMPDALEGEALVLDARGDVLLSKRVSARSPPSSGGFGSSPYNEPRRIEALISNFAHWTVQGLH